MGKLFTEEVGKVLTRLLGNYLTEALGKVLDIYILYEVGDINRFANVRAFCSYCRVVPGIHQSSDKTYRSPNSKQGNHYLKWTFS